MANSNLDLRLVRKKDPYGKNYLALNLGRDYLETSVFLTKEDLLYLLHNEPEEVGKDAQGE